MNLDDSIRNKIAVNGHMEDVSQLAQGLKFALRRGKNWDPLAPGCKEVLEQIATRIAMILSGDANSADHWNEIAMLARTIGRPLEEHAKQPQIDRTAEINAARERAGIKTMAPVEPEYIHEGFGPDHHHV